MSQPVFQLETFKGWAGVDSDISYYLGSHHIDIACEILKDRALPTRVTASASTGIATAPPYNCIAGTEDTITLLVDWQSTSGSATATSIFTASWTAPEGAGVHSEQRFHYVGAQGEVTVDQAHRGYRATEASSTRWINPFYMAYQPDARGHFAGQRGYGYLSIESFIDAVRDLQNGASRKDVEIGLPTLQSTILVTAILEAGRRSLDEKRPIALDRKEDIWTLV